MVFDRAKKSDYQEIIALRSNPELMQFIPRPLLKTKEDALEHLSMIDAKIESNEGINWAIRNKGNSKLIGLIGFYRIKPEHFRAEIGYMLLSEYHGKGFISEAVKRLIQFGFEEIHLHSIEAVIDPKNYSSEKVLLKNGFIKEAHFKENEFFNGVFYDSVIYSLLNN
ncbi:GNAT family N-acetyltransferase [Flavobacterium agrisoli]|uniref:GNAT family N-acetyltransferase n=1 Tax=Flavobacterium agrisoli TaxID=2793066 RepID=UPI001F256BB5|nr:GNAT family N-acetyltransferase [Flavobacterium agrisoli]